MVTYALLNIYLRLMCGQASGSFVPLDDVVGRDIPTVMEELTSQIWRTRHNTQFVRTFALWSADNCLLVEYGRHRLGNVNKLCSIHI